MNQQSIDDMEGKFESLVCNWDEAIPNLLIDLVNTVMLTTSEKELRAAIALLSTRTDLDLFFAYGYGARHFWVKQRLITDPDKVMENRLLIVQF